MNHKDRSLDEALGSLVARTFPAWTGARIEATGAAFMAELARHGLPVAAMEFHTDFHLSEADFGRLDDTGWRVDGRPIRYFREGGRSSEWVLQPSPEDPVMLRVPAWTDCRIMVLTSTQVVEAMFRTRFEGVDPASRLGEAMSFARASLDARARDGVVIYHEELDERFEREFGARLTSFGGGQGDSTWFRTPADRFRADHYQGDGSDDPRETTGWDWWE